MAWLAGGRACPGAADGLEFGRDIRPVLAKNCYACHGPDAAERKAGLRLDTREGSRAVLKSGNRAVVPGDAGGSELVRRITAANAEDRMPPARSGKTLTAADVATLTKWVEQGGNYTTHWAYVHPVKAPVPSVRQGGWPRCALDAFLLARLERERIEPAPEADRRTLLRRVSLDITGLPLTQEDARDFLDDPSPDAYERLVDRLLASNACGEHWARMWLDLARYADSSGYADDPARQIWGYRDWVIRALNSGMSFDEFTVEQLAGDLLPAPTQDQLIATAFHRNTQTNNEGGTDDEEFRNVAVVDRVNTTMAVWMGTTLGCAQCHDHKYDPITQDDYFRLFAVFNNTADADRPDESPTLPFLTETAEQKSASIRAEVEALERTLRTPTKELERSQQAWEAAFPLEVPWAKLQPLHAASKAGPLELSTDGSFEGAATASGDTWTIELPAGPAGWSALRFESLPLVARTEAGNPPAAAGEFVVTRVNASIVPPDDSPPNGRYVRIDLPGAGRILSLAEVQVLSRGVNQALKGQASQQSTDYSGDAARAIDGKTDGNYDAGSTTHTENTTDPWWEVDLKSSHPIERVVVWNRTDSNLQSRLEGFRISVLDEQRAVVWKSAPQKAPAASVSVDTGGARAVAFRAVVEDPVADGSGADSVISEAGGGKKGWAVPSASPLPEGAARSAALTLLAASAAKEPAGARLRVVVDVRARGEGPARRRLRLSATSHPKADEWARTPGSVLRTLGVEPSARSAEDASSVAAYFRTTVAEELRPTREALAARKKELSEIAPNTVPILRELADDARRKTWIQRRGNFLDRGPEVSEGLPSAFPQLEPGTRCDRLALARWLVRPDNPLTARVTVNRTWEKIFGVGFVVTSEEFGSQGEPPSHPELLDWLALDLVEHGWDLKRLVRQIVTSSAYRQSSRVTADLYERDPDNRLVARGPRFRMTAETIRDQTLAAAGLLSRKMYGPPVKPPQPTSGLSAAFGSAIDWQTSSGEDRYRRGIYVTWRRSSPYPSMATFDATNREVCTIRRARTNTPLQALVTLNDPVYVEAAQALARRLSEAGPAGEAMAQRGFELCLARPPTSEELHRILDLKEAAQARFAKDLEAAKKMATDPIGPVPEGRDVVELAAWTVVANVLLNLDEFFLCR
ncbi:MAG TPA: DUF1553 domain-containing protein [Planctomycetota bacterium]|nr:DUF1553 domain-containing protein [Planctomycetota bacterium]